jgi:hypothetical protein
MTSDYRINGAILCGNDISGLTGFQLQISKNNGISYSDTINLYNFGYSGSSCSVLNIIPTDRITKVYMQYSTTAGINRLSFSTFLNQNVSVGPNIPTNLV